MLKQLISLVILFIAITFVKAYSDTTSRILPKAKPKEILKSEHFDYFIFGHRHLPLDVNISDKSRYINLGEWVNYYSYGVINQGHFELKFFESAFSKAINK